MIFVSISVPSIFNFTWLPGPSRVMDSRLRGNDTLAYFNHQKWRLTQYPRRPLQHLLYGNDFTSG